MYVHSYKHKKLVDFLPMSPHSKISDLTKFCVCRVYNLHIEIIKQNQTSNDQYKFRANLHKYHDLPNVEDYFMIYIRPERCDLKTSHK
jgi:hypothetical protein